MWDCGPQDNDIVATTFKGIIPNGVSCLLEMLVMGFGLNNVPAIFSRLVNHVLEPYIYTFIIVDLDYICIYSETRERHIERLRIVLQKICEHKLFNKMPKYVWGRKEIEYIGVIIAHETLQTTLEKIQM